MTATHWVGNGDKAGAIGKDRFHLDLGDDVGYSREYVVRAENCAPDLQCFDDRLAVSSGLSHGIGNQGDGLGNVEQESA